MEKRVSDDVHCPSCGAPVTGAARRCSFCGSGVATVRCARCFHMSVPTALHCTGCGAELGLEPIADTAHLVCPGCGIELSAFAGETGKLYDCGRCGGQFVEAD